jgi:uncharacterized protein (TIGR03067 family)
MRALAIVALAVFAVPDRPDPTPKESTLTLTEQIHGEWQVIDALARGQPNGAIKANQAVFRFEGEKMLLRLAPGAAKEYEYRFSVDAAKSPATFDFSIATSAAKNANVGIIKIEGDVMTICYSFVGATGRPNEFASTATSNTALWKLRRVSKTK